MLNVANPVRSAPETDEDLPRATKGSVAVLVCNLGSPDKPDTASVRRYLREFLSDRRVIELSPWIWKPLLNGVILVRRPAKTAHNYQNVWNKEHNEAPLISIVRAQTELLAGALARDNVVVDWAMRYGKRSVGSRVQALAAAGVDRILIAALYPQYSASTIATVNDVAFAALQKMRVQPALRTLPAYFDEPSYIEALAVSLEKTLSEIDFEPEKILITFHGLPRSYIRKGDPYESQVEETTRLLKARIAPKWGDRFMLTYQSRFGKAEWTKPYTDETIAASPSEGIKKLLVMMPGFSADCLETLEEMAVTNAELFHENGGTHYAAVPCLNDSSAGMHALETVIRRELSGWI